MAKAMARIYIEVLQNKQNHWLDTTTSSNTDL